MKFDQLLDNAPGMTVPRPRRVAIIHDWLIVYGGAERVLRELLSMYPDADLFAMVDFLVGDDRAKLFGKHAKTSFIQNMPFAKTKYRGYLPFMPVAVEQLDVSGYDMVISSSYAVAKGVLTGPDQFHICYCHSPIRYAWDLQHQYLREGGLKSVVARMVLHYVRLWDVRTAAGVDVFVANSAYIARRIKKVYGRDSVVVHPPVDIENFQLRTDKEDFYFTASRMVPYKRIDLIVEAFTAMPDRRLVVIGDGPEMSKIRRLAGPNVTLLGFQSSEVLRDYMQRARAFVFAAEEDFGILPIEAQACGTPVIAYGKGGALETVVGSGAETTGVFFEEQSVGGIVAAVGRFEVLGIEPEQCRRNAEGYGAGVFREGWRRAARDGAASVRASVVSIR